MRLCRLWHALGRSVGRSAACYVTYWPGNRQNARQNGSQWPCVTVWGLVLGVTAALDTVPGVPGCYHARRGRPGRLFEGTRGAAPDLGPAPLPEVVDVDPAHVDRLLALTGDDANEVLDL